MPPPLGYGTGAGLSLLNIISFYLPYVLQKVRWLWLALFSDLSKRGWCNCILETTGLNAREGFLSDALPFDRIIIVRLEASRKVLMQRIGLKKKSEQGGKWLYSGHFKNKYDFVNKLYPAFKLVVYRFAVKTDKMTKKEVFDAVLNRINMESYIDD